MTIGKTKLTWLNGGVIFLDGGAMFGVVPKPLWTRKYPYDESEGRNVVELRTDPILIQINGKNYLIDAGIGNGKLTDKQMRNFGVKEEAAIEQSLEELGLTTEDIDAVLMTHLHFDHACGLTYPDGDRYLSTFPNAIIYTSETEWHEMKNPNIRSVNTYWRRNWEAIKDQVTTFKDVFYITDELRFEHTGGHSDGHCILVYDDGDEKWIHMADIMPTHGHQNKLWVLAYDDYPVTSVHAKERWMNYGYENEVWHIFYHDAYYRAIKFDREGVIVDSLKRERYSYEQ